MATTKKISFENALGKIQVCIVAAHEARTTLEKKSASEFTVAINFAIDAGKKEGKTNAEIKEGVRDLFAAEVDAGRFEKSTARTYGSGIIFALDHGVLWSPDLHSTDGQVKALTDAGKKIPKAVADRVTKATAKREAKHGPVAQASVENTVKLLSKAYDMAVLIGKAGWAVHIKEAIQAEKPEWTPPTAEGK
jgi:hypothetical protein